MTTTRDMHTRHCLAASLICAIENIRDEEGETDFDFRISAQDNYFLEVADDYLTQGTKTCICPPLEDTMTTADEHDDADFRFYS